MQLTQQLLIEHGFESEDQELPERDDKLLEGFRVENVYGRADSQESVVVCYMTNVYDLPDEFYWVDDDGEEIRIHTVDELLERLPKS